VSHNFCVNSVAQVITDSNVVENNVLRNGQKC